MRILITGATGQLGQALLASKPKNYEIIVPSRVELDLTSSDSCQLAVERYSPDWIINTAAYTNVDKAEDEPELERKINTEAPYFFAKGLLNSGGKLLQLSTDFVFDGLQGKPYLPSQATCPIGIYGKTKANGEKLINKVLGVTSQALILRTSWLMGPVGKNFALTMLKLHKSKEELSVVESVKVEKGIGLVGDHFKGSSSGKRQVTLIQQEHLNVISKILGEKRIDPKLTRRNIVVSGINLLSLKQQQFRIGDVTLETTGICAPCSRMEENLGAGGYNAMRGHGGITSTVIEDGEIKLGDSIELI